MLPMESLQTPDRLVRLAVDLVNTRTLEPEQLTKPADVRQFLLDHGESEPIRITWPVLVEVREVRELIRPAFHVEPAEAARLLNELLAEYAVRPYLSDHDGSPWHLHVAKPGANWAQWMAAGTALGLAGFAAGHGFQALGVCAAQDCERVFVNPAARRPRRFCTPTCAGRTRVASHRARQATN
ncbi:CGNR zinc finger domain-containing protein [Kribbella endophytica]